MDIEQLSKFLVKAKINTYASSGKGGEKYFPMEVKNLNLKKKSLNTEIDILDLTPSLVRKLFGKMKK